MGSFQRPKAAAGSATSATRNDSTRRSDLRELYIYLDGGGVRAEQSQAFNLGVELGLAGVEDGGRVPSCFECVQGADGAAGVGFDAF